jgi:hypothetical protein
MGLMVVFFIIISIFFIEYSESSFVRLTRKLQTNSTEENFTVNTDYGECRVQYCGDGVCALDKADCLVNVTTKTKYCKCREGYTTFPQDDSFDCCYEQKNANTAMLLEIFIGFGFGHFYVGNNLIGIIKASVYLVLSVSCCLVLYRVFRLQDQGKSFIFKFTCTICLLLCSCTYIGWQIIDSILFSIGGYTDKNQAPLSGIE